MPNPNAVSRNNWAADTCPGSNSCKDQACVQLLYITNVDYGQCLGKATSDLGVLRTQESPLAESEVSGLGMVPKLRSLPWVRTTCPADRKAPRSVPVYLHNPKRQLFMFLGRKFDRPGHLGKQSTPCPHFCWDSTCKSIFASFCYMCTCLKRSSCAKP